MTADIAAGTTPGEPRGTRVAVVGAGWAGLAAAIELVEAGLQVTLFEAAPTPGGRARGLSLKLDGTEVELDNGQHLIIGAYRECLRLARRVGVRVEDADQAGSPETGALLRRHRLRLDSTDGLSIATARLPAPLNLLAGLATARGLTLQERVRMAAMLASLRLAGWRVPRGETVAAMLARMRQPGSLRRRLWEPLAIAALNTAADEACAQTFANVLRDSLGTHARSSDFMLPSGTLSDVLPVPALSWLRAHGVETLLRTAVREIRTESSGWALRTDRGEWHADALVLATPAWVSARLLEPVAITPQHASIVKHLSIFAPESLATVYLAWPAADCPALPAWIMLDEHAAPDAYGQWLFDRGVQRGLRLAAVVISARGRLSQATPAALGEGVCRQIAAQLRVPVPGKHRVVVEKRATFKCRPDRPEITATAFADAAPHASPRLPGAASFATLMLAGDYAWPEYPATLEAAARSGVAAARRLTAILPDP